MSLKSLHAFVIPGKCVFLMSSYDCTYKLFIRLTMCLKRINRTLLLELKRSPAVVPSGELLNVTVKGQIAGQFTLVFGGLFPMCQIPFLLFSYNGFA